MSTYPNYPNYGYKEDLSVTPMPCPPTSMPCPPQLQKPPGIESKMCPKPISINPSYKGSGKLTGKVAIITGGDSGIGRAVAYYYAMEGASLSIAYLNEVTDAEETKELAESLGSRVLLFEGDLGNEKWCREVVTQTYSTYGRLDILVNNHVENRDQKSILDISSQQLESTFRTNIFSYFYLCKAAIPHLKRGSSIINTSSRVAETGDPYAIDYSATKGAVSTFTKALALNLAQEGIRVNAVAPGAFWTPLQVTRAINGIPLQSVTYNNCYGQPFEIAPAYVYLASDDSIYVSGQILTVDNVLEKLLFNLNYIYRSQ